MVLFPLLMGCGGKDTIEVPPPSVPEVTPGDGDDGKDDGPHPWDENRGKKVTPSGTGWTSTTLEDGIVYYTFSGKDPVTGANQRVFVTDLDLSNPSYSVKLAYYSERSTASKVFSSRDAIVCMNGGYERGSIVIWINGTHYYTMPDNTIGTTGVANWKSEAAIYMDNDRDVRIAFSGKNKTIAAQRSYYMSLYGKENTVLTSAPMLIDDYEPVGENFVSRYSPAPTTNSEEPAIHQQTRHPRTVLAKTEFNHLIMMVIDGRRNVSAGMSAAEVTKFLVANFNPQYAINLDGGGSSTLCVAGQGDPDTHVVNYPTDSDNTDPRPGAGDHTGERSVPTFFYVVKK